MLGNAGGMFGSETASARSGSADDLRLAQAYPFSRPQSRSYPEQDDPLYSVDAGKWGACFSSGGARAFSAALERRGLHEAGVLPQIGAISAVSGGSWFCTTFSFAPSA